jgi:ubiquinone/menaquinone biosynthesis C-methylase UbiE
MALSSSGESQMDESPDKYVLGYSEYETRRLMVQAELYRPQTDHLLCLAGIGPGMRVLDVGCGAGDVSLQVASLVGPTGSVVGVDADSAVLAVAARRARESYPDTVTFRRATLPDVAADEPFDAVVGRLILMHLPDPVDAVRRLSALVRPGGIVSFQDFNISAARSVPESPLLARCLSWIATALRAAGRNPDIGDEIVSVFQTAGFPTPGVAAATPASSDPESIGYEAAAAIVTSLLPVIEKTGVATRAEVGPDTLLHRLRADGREHRSLVYFPELAGVWARVPD